VGYYSVTDNMGLSSFV